MANLDPFTAQIVQYVRSMPDEALLTLVRAHLTGDAEPLAPARSARSAPLPRPAATGAPAKKTAKKKAGRKKKRAASRRAPDAQRQALLDTVEKVVAKSKGMSASQVAKKVNAPQSRVTSVLRELKAAKRVYQGGERRFARYAGDAKTAEAASENARRTASGPIRRR